MEQLRIEAYKLYEADCRLKGINAISKIRSKGFQTAIDMFSETVKEEHFLDFVNQPCKKLEIENHFEKGILMLNEKGNLVINAAGEEEGDFLIGEKDDLVFNAADGEKGVLMIGKKDDLVINAADANVVRAHEAKLAEDVRKRMLIDRANEEQEKWVAFISDTFDHIG
ncbi:ATPase family AAA domain-containing protein 3-like, partial [Trifolium medium]|nr:ATPase family AAA domain-containing protein 3-like [Trifolium medium]